MFKLCLLACTVAFVAADVSLLPNQGRPYPHILRQESEIDPSGNYKWSYDTENGISAQEQGAVYQEPQEEILRVQGSYQYTSPDGSPVIVTYTADENGFRPQVKN